MIPQLQCSIHQQEIIVVNLHQDAQQRSRLFCGLCLEEVQERTQFLQIRRIPEIATSLKKEIIKEIDEEYEQGISLINYLIKQWTTLRDQTIEQFNILIRQSQLLIQSFKTDRDNEKIIYENLTQNFNNSKIEMIAKYINGNEQRKSQHAEIKQQNKNLGDLFLNIFNSIQENQKNIQQESQNLLQRKMTLKSSFESRYRHLAYNEQNQMLANQLLQELILIHKFENNELKQKSYFKLDHFLVYNLVFNKSGNIIFCNARVELMIWKQQNNIWNCTNAFRFNFFSIFTSIVELQISPNDDQFLVSFSTGKTEIYKIIETEKTMECIQGLSAYCVSINPNSQLLAACNQDNLITIYQFLAGQVPSWIRQKEIKTKYRNGQVKFIDESQLVCLSIKNHQFLSVYKLNIFGDYYQAQELQIDDKCLRIKSISIKGNTLLLIGEKFAHLIRKSQNGKFNVELILPGNFHFGVANDTAQWMILENRKTECIEVYSYS